MGYRIAQGDLGMDGSNVSRPSVFPRDIIELNTSLTRGIDQSTINPNILGSARVLSTSFSNGVIAEGVETIEESRIPNDLGIHLHQGFLYGHAMPTERAREVLQMLASAVAEPHRGPRPEGLLEQGAGFDRGHQGGDQQDEALLLRG